MGKALPHKRSTARLSFKLRTVISALIISALVLPLLSSGNFASAGLNSDDLSSQTTTATASTEATGTPDTPSLSDQKFTATVYTDSTLTTPTADNTVHISGDMPTGGYATAYPVDPSLEDADVLVAYDITVYWANGTKFEVDTPLNVSIDVPDMPDLMEANLGLVYIPPEGQQPEALMTPVSATDSGVSFDVDHLSTYAITITNVNTYDLNLDGVTTTGLSITAPYSGTVYSDYPGQVHTLTFTSTNTNLTFTSVNQDGTETLGGPFKVGTTGPTFNSTLTFTDSTVITLAFNNGTTNRTITYTIKVQNNYFYIKDAIPTQNGLLIATLSDAFAADVASYVWMESASAGGPYVPVDPSVISGDGTSVNVAEDNGSLMYYKLVATLTDDTTVESDPYQVLYYTALMNGGFEQPDVSTRAAGNTNYSNFANGTPGLVWQTTASDNMIEISQPGTTVYGVSPNEGQRFAELNANAVGTLYQDVLVTPGETLYWTLSHAGRVNGTINPSGVDTMYVVIAPSTTGSAADIPAESVGAPSGTIVLSPDGTVSVATITDGPGTWNSGNGGEKYSGDYVVPDGVYVVRFYFESATTDSSATFGNLLDDITFDANMPYSIEYYVDGVLMATSATYKASSGTLINANGTITDPSTGATMIPALATLFTTYDTNPDYSLQQTVLTTRDHEGNDLSGGTDLNRATEFTLRKANSVLQLYYVTKGVFVNKTVSGVPPDDMPQDTYLADFGLYDKAGSLLATATVTMSGGSITGSAEFLNSAGNPVGLDPETTYIVKELTTSDIPGYTYVSTTPIAATAFIDSVETTIDPVPTGTGMIITFSTPASSKASIYEAYYANTYKKSTIDFTFFKVGEQDVPLEGVQFKLTPRNGDDSGWDVASTITVTSDADGKVVLPDLLKNTYFLQEVTPYPGYVLPSGSWILAVDPDATPAVTFTPQGSPTAFQIQDGVYTLVNYKRWNLPFAGSWGVIPYVIGGVVLVGGAFLTLSTSRKKKAQRA